MYPRRRLYMNILDEEEVGKNDANMQETRCMFSVQRSLCLAAG